MIGNQCGTLPGYMAHVWSGTQPCGECEAWRAQYPYRLDYMPSHGDSGNGYHWHRYARVPQCETCRISNREYHRNLKARKAQL